MLNSWQYSDIGNLAEYFKYLDAMVEPVAQRLESAQSIGPVARVGPVVRVVPVAKVSTRGRGWTRCKDCAHCYG